LITPQTESSPLPCFSPSVTSKKKQKQKKRKEKQENERERIEPENKQKKYGKETKRLSHLGRF
jgi:hypothetical protein